MPVAETHKEGRHGPTTKKRRHVQCDKKRKAILTIQGRKGQMKQGSNVERTNKQLKAEGRASIQRSDALLGVAIGGNPRRLSTRTGRACRTPPRSSQLITKGLWLGLKSMVSAMNNRTGSSSRLIRSHCVGSNFRRGCR